MTADYKPTRTETTTPGGIEIIAREPALGPHPNPNMRGKMVRFNNANRLLLANDAVVFECDSDGLIFHKLTQVVAHRSGAHRTKPRIPDYTEQTLRALARLCHQFGVGSGGKLSRGTAEKVADELNRRGIRPAKIEQWNAALVSSVWRKHAKDLRVQVRRPVQWPQNGGEPQAHPRPVRVTGGPVARLLDLIEESERLVAHLRDAAAGIADQLAGVDADTKEKAAKYDQLRLMLGKD